MRDNFKTFLVLFALMLLPNMAWAQTITVAGSGPDENGNFSTGITSGSVTFDATTNTLTLNNAHVNGTISSDILNLNVSLVGVSVFHVTTDEFTYLFNNTNGTATGTLTFSGNIGAALIAIGSQKQNWLDLSHGYDEAYDPNEPAAWVNKSSRGENTGDYPVIKVSKPYLKCGSYEFDDSYNDDTYDQKLGNVGFNPSTKTLTLSGANIDEKIIWKKSAGDLTINFSGANSIVRGDSATLITSESNMATLTFTKSGEGTASLTLQHSDQGANAPSIISGFGSIDYTTAGLNISSSSPIEAEYKSKNIDQGVTLKSLVNTSDNDRCIHSATITSATLYPLWIGDKQVTSENADNIEPTTKTSGTASFTAGTTNILTLDGFKMSIEEDNQPAIISGLSNLTILLKGDNYTAGNNINFTGSGGYVVSSTDPNATLTFKADETYSQLAIARGSTGGYTGSPSDGFDRTNYENGLMWIAHGTTTQSIINPVPEIYMDRISIPQYKAGMSLVYSIDYANETTQDITDATYDAGESLNIDINEPCTITAHVEYGSLSSTIAKAKYYEIKDKTIVWSNDYATGTTDFSASSLECTPAIQEGDGVELIVSGSSHEDVIEITRDENSNPTGTKIKGLGATTIDINFGGQGDGFTVLNEAGQATVSIVPPAPTIAKDDTKDYLDTDYITITQTTITGAYIKYTWEEGANAPWSDYVATTGVLAQTGTLRAKVRYYFTNDVYVESAEATSVAFTVKTDISGYFVNGLPESTSYTGSAIVLPDFTVKETATANTSLIAGTDYTVSYKKVGEGDVLTDETTMEDVGYYKIVITGAGNYGGSITVDFEITKADAGLKFYKEEDGKVVQVTTASATYGTAFEAPSLDNPQNLSITYRSKVNNDIDGEDSEVATIDATTGVITINRPGEAYIFASTTGNDNYAAATVSYTLTVNKGSLGSVTIAPIADQEYTGSEITPDLEVTTPDGTAIDVSTGDYDILYDNNISAGEATITVAAKNSNKYFYEGSSKQATFTITQLDISNATVTLDNTTLIYNGSVQTVNVTTVSVGDIEVPIDCYEVSGNTGTEIGDYTLTVTAKTMDSSGNPIKNNFTGSAEKDWKIKYRTVTADELGLSDNQTYATYFNNTENLELPDGIVAYIITGVSGTTVTTKRISYIPKDVAVLVESGTSTEDAVDVATDNQLQGTAAAKDVSTITGGAVYVLYKSEFVKTTTGTIPANRCYLVVSGGAGARSLSISHGEGNGTGIKDVMLEEDGTEKWYDLQGRRINQPTKPGLYILNGKKTTIKKQ